MNKTEMLRSAYGNIKSIDPEGTAYENLCNLLDARTNEELKDFVAANIKWISALAYNRLITRGALNG